MNNQFDLHGKTAVVSGARRGIGRAMTLALATAGADIVAVSATMGESDSVVDEVRSLGRVCEVHQVDFADREAVMALGHELAEDRKSTRLNSSHVAISYAVFCLTKKTTTHTSPMNPI